MRPNDKLRIRFWVMTILAVLSIDNSAWIALESSVFAQSRNSRTQGQGDPLVTINGEAITTADLARVFQTRRVPTEKQAEFRRAFLEEMIDAQLIRQFLAQRKVKASSRALDQQITQIRQIAAREGDPDAVLQAQGYTQESLRREFELPLAWQAYIEQTYEGRKLQELYAKRHQEFDGTKVHARQIFLKVDTSRESPELSAALEQLLEIREQILAKKISFEEAAKKYSESPNRDRGGDLGEFTYSGRMPEAFSEVAFKMQPGQVSAPFKTRAGVHLCELVGKTPGDLNLEDVRKEVLSRIAIEEWKATARQLRREATVTWVAERP